MITAKEAAKHTESNKQKHFLDTLRVIEKNILSSSDRYVSYQFPISDEVANELRRLGYSVSVTFYKDLAMFETVISW